MRRLLRAEEPWLGCDHHLSFNVTARTHWISFMYTESWSCNNPHLGYWCMQVRCRWRSFSSESFEGVSVSAGKKRKSWVQIQGADGNSYRNIIGHVASRKKLEILWAKYWFKEVSDWEQASGFCFFHVMEIKHFYIFFKQMTSLADSFTSLPAQTTLHIGWMKKLIVFKLIPWESCKKVIKLWWDSK